MKTYLIILFFLISTIVFSQNLKKCGIDNSPKLTSLESVFLNDYLSDRINEFDFTNKKIIFVSGNSGNYIKNKSDYFYNIKKRIENDTTNTKVASSLIKFSEEEKKDSGGYDAIICYWTKFITKRRIRKIISEMKSKTN